MKTVFYLITSLIILLSINAYAGDNSIFSGEENTLSLYRELSAALLKNPAGEKSFRYIVKLLDISRDAGRVKTADLFRRCAEKISSGGRVEPPVKFVLNYYAEYLDKGPWTRDSEYIGVDKWRISGPWERYGSPDLYSPFPPETDRGFDKYRSIRTEDRAGRIFPFGYIPERRGVSYAAVSFTADGPIRIWVASNARYRLFVNGSESVNSMGAGEFSLAGAEVRGGKGYSLLLKIADNSGGDDPWFRIIITDSGNRILKPEISGIKYSEGVSVEKIFSSYDIKSSPDFEGGVEKRSIRNKIVRDPAPSYEELRLWLKEYPLYGEIYHRIIPVIIKNGSRSEFAETVREYMRRFPDSDFSLKWEAEFYRGSDPEKFQEAMDKLHPLYLNRDLAAAFIKLLAEDDEEKALKFSEKSGDLPSFRELTADIVKSDSSTDEWRKFLIRRIAVTGDPLYFYLMGNAEMERGLDPLLYWEKALSIRSDMREVREAADIFENSGGKGSRFYSGVYTDLHPEFLWNGIKRRVTVRVFAGGNYMAECEEIIPGPLAAKGEFKLLQLEELRPLYVLSCKGGEAVPQKFDTVKGDDGTITVKFKVRDKAEFAVIRYTGYASSFNPPFSIFKGLQLKNGNEDVSEVLLEVISEVGSPSVYFMDKKIAGINGEKPGETVFRASGRFNYKDNSGASASAGYLTSDREFALWFSGLMKVMKSRGVQNQISTPLTGDMNSKITALREYIRNGYTVKDGRVFDPRFSDDVIRSQAGTTVELAILSSIILEQSGVKGAVVFIREKGEPVSDKMEGAFFIPGSKGRGEWIRFTDGKNFKNGEALIIKGDSLEIIPVSDKSGYK